MLNLQYGTPIEEVSIGKLLIRVKRDDLANGNDLDAPPLGKLRGLLGAIRASGGGVRTVGAVDRRPTSRNSWATAYLCRELGLTCHAFFSELGPYQEKAVELGAQYTLLPGLELEALYLAAAEDFYGRYPGESFMPVDDCQATALVEDAEREVLRSERGKLVGVDTVIIPTGSGGLAMGVMRGLIRLGVRPTIILHAAGSRRSEDYLHGIVDGAGLRREFPSVRVVKERGDYILPDFPCNPTYELPAWTWMLQECKEGIVLFWNAGG